MHDNRQWDLVLELEDLAGLKLLLYGDEKELEEACVDVAKVFFPNQRHAEESRLYFMRIS